MASFSPHSFAMLYVEEGPRILRRFRRRGLSTAEAEDLAQEAFLKLLNAPPEDLREPKAYLARVAEHVFIDRIRRARRAQAVTPSGAPPSEEVADARPSAEAALIAREEEEALDRALAELPPRCREVLKLHKFEGLSYAEISAKMGISRNTVMVHMVKGLGVLRRRLKEPAGET